MFSFLRKNNEPVVLRKKAKPRHLSQLQLQILVGVGITVVITCMVTAIYFLTRISSMQIVSVEVIGGETISHQSVVGIVNSNLDGAYFKLIPRRFRPVYPHDVIVGAIEAEDRIKNVQVRVDNQVLTVVFEEYTPYALWCEHKDSNSCLFMDSVGFAFSKAPTLEGSAFVRYVEEGIVPQAKNSAFESSYIKNAQSFIEGLEQTLSLYVTHVTKVGNYDSEYTISGGAVIKVSEKIPMEKTFANLETILHSKEFKNIEPGSFQYIDLRFGDKVFVNEATPQSGTSTVSSANEVRE